MDWSPKNNIRRFCGSAGVVVPVCMVNRLDKLVQHSGHAPNQVHSRTDAFYIEALGKSDRRLVQLPEDIREICLEEFIAPPSLKDVSQGPNIFTSGRKLPVDEERERGS